MSTLQENLDAIKLDKDTNLKPENLKAGTTCLGIEGTMESGIDTSDATATKSDILSGKTAYANGEKITGNIQDLSGYTCGADIGSHGVHPYKDTNSLYSIVDKTDENGLLEKSLVIRNYSGKYSNKWHVATENLSSWLGIRPDTISNGFEILGVTGINYGFKAQPCPTYLTLRKANTVSASDTLYLNEFSIMNDWNYAEQYGLTFADMQKQKLPYSAVILTIDSGYVQMFMFFAQAPFNECSWSDSSFSVSSPMIAVPTLQISVGAELNGADNDTAISELLDYMKSDIYPSTIMLAGSPYVYYDDAGSFTMGGPMSTGFMYTNYDPNAIY